MMPAKDFLQFLSRRAKADPPIVFFWRMVRFLYLFICVITTRKKPFAAGVYQINGSKMYLNPSDKGISADLAQAGIREPFMTMRMQGILKEGDIVVDIGANIGYYALLECRGVGENGHVYAIEPVPENYDLLSTNIQLNGYSNIIAHRYALGDHIGEMDMHISSMCNMSTLKKSEYRSYSDVIKVPMTTLDSYLLGKAYPDLIRMDTEGFEYEIIVGAKETLSKDKPLKIYMELHFDILRDKAWLLLYQLERYGFHVNTVSFEPHPASRNFKLLSYLDGKVGLVTGYSTLTIDDLMQERFINGQIEDIEVLFER